MGSFHAACSTPHPHCFAGPRGQHCSSRCPPWVRKTLFEMNIVSPCRLVSFPARCPEPDRALKGAEQTELRQLYAETQALSLVSLRSFYCYTLPFFFLPESSHNTLISRENTRLPHKRVNPQRGKYKQTSSCTQIGAQVKHTGFLRVHQAPFIARYCVSLWSLEVSFLPCCPPAFWASTVLLSLSSKSTILAWLPTWKPLHYISADPQGLSQGFSGKSLSSGMWT